MGKISAFLGKPVAEGVPGLFPDGPIQTIDVLVSGGSSSSCLITGEKNPKKGGFYNNGDCGYLISSRTVTNVESLRQFMHLGMAIGDAILDSDTSPESEETIIQTILWSIKNGVRHTIACHRKHDTKKICESGGLFGHTS